VEHGGLRNAWAVQRLVVEVDGGYHRERAAADARRDRVLDRLGWRVLRVSAAEVIAGAEAVAARVAEAIGGAG